MGCGGTDAMVMMMMMMIYSAARARRGTQHSSGTRGYSIVRSCCANYGAVVVVCVGLNAIAPQTRPY